MRRQTTSVIKSVILISLGLLIICWPLFLALALFFGAAGLVFVILTHQAEKYKFKTTNFDQVDSMSGLEFEEYIGYLLKKNGYNNVAVTRASGDYGVDLLANCNGKKYAFQCKRYESNVGVQAVQEVFAGAKMYKADVIVVVTNKYFTPNAKNMADKLGVLLWDRDALIHLIQKSRGQK